jgi:AcrR family transcriptional regulator
MSAPRHVDKRNDRGQATRAHILNVATKLFAADGYEATSIDVVLQASGVSRGALYHHFANKEAVFAAVLENVEASVAKHVAAAAAGATNPLDALRAGCAAWLELARDATVRQVVLVDAPSVIGWKTWRELDDGYALGLLKAALGAMAAAGRFRREMIDTYAHLLLAAMIEASLLVARASDAADAVAKGREALEGLLSRVAAVEPNQPWDG